VLEHCGYETSYPVGEGGGGGGGFRCARAGLEETVATIRSNGTNAAAGDAAPATTAAAAITASAKKRRG